MPVPLLRRRKPAPEVVPQRRPLLPPDHLEAHEQSLRLQYHSKTSDGIRMAHDDKGPTRLPALLEGIAQSKVELVEPVSIDLQQAAPAITRPDQATLWITAHRERSPSQGPLEIGPTERRIAVTGSGAQPCSHCGFTAVDRRAHYCPKCGMRTGRG